MGSNDHQPLERVIEDYLVKRVRAMGGEIRKVKWIGRRGAPDRRVMLNGNSFWAELKRPGEEPEAHQAREHKRMRAMGERVEVIDSFEQIDRLLGGSK